MSTPSPTTAREWLRRATEALSEADVMFAPKTAALMLAEALQVAPAEVALEADRPLPAEMLPLLNGWLARRLERHPLEYCTGWAWFDGKRFAVTPDVLIPRPSTEFLLEKVVAAIDPNAGPVVEVGTGSGILSICLAERFPQLEILALDISPAALTVAQENAQRLLPPEARAHLRFLQSDLLAALPADVHPQGIVANLPYIPTEQIPTLFPEVQREPWLALDGGTSGLDLIEKLIAQARGRASWLALEIGDDHAPAVKRLCTEGGWPLIQTVPDFTETPRVIIARK